MKLPFTSESDRLFMMFEESAANTAQPDTWIDIGDSRGRSGHVWYCRSPVGFLC